MPVPKLRREQRSEVLEVIAAATAGGKDAVTSSLTCVASWGRRVLHTRTMLNPDGGLDPVVFEPPQ